MAVRRARRLETLLVAGRDVLAVAGRGSGRPLYVAERYVRVRSTSSGVRQITWNTADTEHNKINMDEGSGLGISLQAVLPNAQCEEDAYSGYRVTASLPSRDHRFMPITACFHLQRRATKTALGILSGLGRITVYPRYRLSKTSRRVFHNSPSLLTHLADSLTCHIANTPIQPRQCIQRIRRVKDIRRGL